MASYQELDTRMRVFEDMLSFVMGTIRMSGVVTTGLIGPDGQPTGKKVEGSLLDLYRMAKTDALGIVTSHDAPPPSVTEN